MPDEQSPATPSGQAPAPVQPAQGTGQTSSWEPVEYQWEDGEKTSFKSKEDLLKYVREGTLRHRDYTKKTQELAKQREAHAKRESDLERSMQEILEKKQKLDPMDKFLNDNPQIAERIVAEMRGKVGQPSNDQLKKMIEEATKPLQEKLSETENWKKEQETAARRQQLFSHFKTQYQDFNEEVISQRLKEYDEVPEGDEDRAFYELLYFAEKGRNPTASPLEIEKKVAAAIASKNGKRSPVPSANASPTLIDELPSQVRQSKDPIRAAAEHYKKTHA